MVAIAFDVYGTLVDPLAIRGRLNAIVGGEADRFATLWREKQLEYSFRRAVMRQYVSFDICTAQALRYVVQALGAPISETDEADLLARYRTLPPFPDVVPGIERLKGQGHTLVAFSNGVEASVRALLDHAGILPLLDDVVSVDDVRMFKPDPEVYAYLARRVNQPPAETWLVSGNPFDVIGAKAAGLRAVWLTRNASDVFDPWGIEPDFTVSHFQALTVRFATSTGTNT